VGFVADRVNLWTELLVRGIRMFIEQHLDLIVMLLKQWPDLLLLFRCQLQIFGETSEFLVDGLPRMDVLELFTR
jgi:hypothetical protein